MRPVWTLTVLSLCLLASSRSVVATTEPCCTNEADMCLSLESLEAHILSSEDIHSGNCDVDDDCLSITCHLEVVKNNFPVSFFLTVSLNPCASPYSVRVSLHAMCDGPKILMIDDEFSSSQSVDVTLLVFDGVFGVKIETNCDGISLEVSLKVKEHDIVFIPMTDILMYCSGVQRPDCVTSPPDPPPDPSSCVYPAQVVATTSIITGGIVGSLSSSAVAASTGPPPSPTVNCCPGLQEMCNSLRNITDAILNLSNTISGDCQLLKGCSQFMCETQLSQSGFVIPFSYTLRFLPCQKSVHIHIQSATLGNIVNREFSNSTVVNVPTFGINSVEISITQERCGFSLLVELTSFGPNIVVVPRTDVKLHCEQRTGCSSESSIPTISPSPTTTYGTMSLSSSEPQFTMIPLPAVCCPPKCNRKDCMAKNITICSNPHAGPEDGHCVLSHCKACYYSVDFREMPTGCERFACGADYTDPSTVRCFKKWARCIRKRDNAIHGPPDLDIRRQRYFKCHSLVSLH